MKLKKHSRGIIILIVSVLLFFQIEASALASMSKAAQLANNLLGTQTHLGFYFNISNSGQPQIEQPGALTSTGMNKSLNITIGQLDDGAGYVLRSAPILFTVKAKTTNLALNLSVVNGTSPTAGKKLSNIYTLGLSFLTLSLGGSTPVAGLITVTPGTPSGLYTGYINATDPVTGYSMLIPISFTVY